MDRYTRIEKVQAAQGKQLNHIEKMLGNHLKHHEIDMNRWIKVYIPLIATITPMVVAFANSDVLVKLIDLSMKLLKLK